jgi:hypothetical protein
MRKLPNSHQEPAANTGAGVALATGGLIFLSLHARNPF